MEVNYFYKTYWLPMERLLGKSEVVENFMFQYLVSKRKSIADMQDGKTIQISKNFLYPTFKSYFDKNCDGETKTAKVKNFLRDLYHCAESLRNFTTSIKIFSPKLSKVNALEIFFRRRPIISYAPTKSTKIIISARELIRELA